MAPAKGDCDPVRRQFLVRSIAAVALHDAAIVCEQLLEMLAASARLSIKNGRFDYVDVVEEHLTDDRKIAAEGVVIAGRWWYPR